MARIRGQLDGRADLVADQMNGVEVVREPDEVAVVARSCPGGGRARRSCTLGGPATSPKLMWLPPSVICSRGFRGVSTNEAGALASAGSTRPRSRRTIRVADRPRHPPPRGRRARAATSPRCRALQDVERGQVDGLDLLRAQHLHGCIRILDVLRGKLKHPRPADSSQAASGAPTAHALASFMRVIYGLRAVVSTGRNGSGERLCGTGGSSRPDSRRRCLQAGAFRAARSRGHAARRGARRAGTC